MENKRAHIIKQITFGVILTLLFVPLIKQQLATKDTSDELAGVFTKATYAQLTAKDLWSGDYQKNTAKYLNENFGFRNTLVRMHNQRLYWSYNQSTTYNVIVGKDDYLFGKTYIDAYYGRDFIGSDSIQKNTIRLKELQEQLRQRGTELVIVFAPGKGSFYPEFIPKKYQSLNKVKNTNLGYYLRAFQKQDINYIDFNAWFLQMKDTSSYPLFPKCGIHWSKYGEYLAADSLVKFINAKGIDGDVELQSITMETPNRDGDYDIGESMNLLFPVAATPMGYPNYQFVQKNKPERPVLVIADSFYWGLFNKGMSQSIFGDGQFWYYNKQIYPDSYETPKEVNSINAFEEMAKNQIIFLICTDGNLNKFPFGLFDN